MLSKNVEPRIVHTKLYSDKANEMLSSVIGQLSDGIWENNPRMESYWRFAEVHREPNGESVIAISPETRISDNYGPRWKCTSNAFLGKSDQEVLEIFGSFIKRIAQHELRDTLVQNGWKRDNMTVQLDYLAYHADVRVAEAYAVYEHLLGCLNFLRKYPPSVDIVAAIGLPRSADLTAREALRKAELEGLSKAWQTEIDSQKAAETAELQALKDQMAAISERYQQLRSKTTDDYLAKKRAAEEAA